MLGRQNDKEKLTSENTQVEGWKGCVWVWRSFLLLVSRELKSTNLIAPACLHEETEDPRG